MQFLREYGSTILIVLVGVLVIQRILVGGPHPLESKPAPDFTLAGLNGEPVNLASHRGKDVVVLDFWASWCPPCRKSLPILSKVAAALKDESVAVYAVNIRENKEQVAEFLRSATIDLRVLLDDTGLVADDYGVTTIPQTVIIDKTGRVHKVEVGLPAWDAEEVLIAAIREALAAEASPSGV